MAYLWHAACKLSKYANDFEVKGWFARAPGALVCRVVRAGNVV